MRSVAYLSWLYSCALVSGCGSDVQEPPGWLQHDEVRKLNGTVRFLDIEGGCWALDIGDRKLEPINLEDGFRVDGLSVTATVRADNNKFSICMIGQTVSVLDIQNR